MYVTGGLGAAHGIEGFDVAYALPNDAYAETCAAIANVYWNHRMFLLHGESKYMDVLERTLYNGLMSGLSLEGDKFFYPNPLVFDGKKSLIKELLVVARGLIVHVVLQIFQDSCLRFRVMCMQ